jgi:hypothetical protein
VDSPALHWVLRDWDVTYSSAPTLTGTPSFVISSSESEVSAPELTSGYRGQEFNWRARPEWETANWLRWSMLHNVEERQEKIILWSRTDLFIDSLDQ